MAIAVDMFPVRLTIGDTTHRLARVFVRDGKATAWVAENGDAVKVAEMDGVSVTPERPRNSATITGTETWAAVRAGSCGCGSPLKRLSISRAMA